MNKVYRIMFVCMGNICRSPLAHAVMEELARKSDLSIEVESSGLSAYHQGASADPRMRKVAQQHGITINTTSQQFEPASAKQYHLILVMDDDNYHQIKLLLPQHLLEEKVRLLRDFDPQGRGEVADPYYNGNKGFELTYQIIERCCQQLLQHLSQQDQQQ